MASERPGIEDTFALPEPDRRRFRFANFELIAASGELFRRDQHRRQPVKLQPQPARVLLYLLERAGEPVTRSELQRHVWPEDHFVDYEQGLNYCIRAVRRALGDEAAQPSFLETIPRRGYRFIAPVEIVEPATDGVPGPPVSLLRPSATARRSERRLSKRSAAIFVGLAIVSLALHWALAEGLFLASAPPKLAVLPLESEDLTFATDLTDGLMAHLATHSEELGVIARDSSFSYHGSDLTAVEIGRELDADYLLTGRVRESGEAVRVSVQLIRVRDETNLWARIYDRPAATPDWDGWVESLCSEIATEIATELTHRPS